MDPHLPNGLKRGLRASANGNRVRIRVDNSTVALVLAGIAFGSAVLNLFYQSSYSREQTAQLSSAETRMNTKYQETETETRMLEYYLLELDAKVIAAGIKPESDSIAAKLKSKENAK